MIWIYFQLLFRLNLKEIYIDKKGFQLKSIYFQFLRIYFQLIFRLNLKEIYIDKTGF